MTNVNMETTLAQNALYDKILVKYKNLKQEKDDLFDQHSKLQKEFESFKIKEQNKYLELQKENNRLSKLFHDVKTENKNLSTKLTIRSQEIKDLSSRFDSKINLEEKNKERDVNLFSKFMGRKPIITNSQDSKLLTILSTYENQKEKLEKKNQDLEKEVLSMKNNTGSPKFFNENFQNKNLKMKNDFIEQIEKLTQEKNILEEQVLKTNEAFNKLKIDLDKMTIKQEDLYKLLDRQKAQNLHLQQTIESYQNMSDNKENVPNNIFQNNGYNSNKFEENQNKKEYSEDSEDQILLQVFINIYRILNFFRKYAIFFLLKIKVIYLRLS